MRDNKYNFNKKASILILMTMCVLTACAEKKDKPVQEAVSVKKVAAIQYNLQPVTTETDNTIAESNNDDQALYYGIQPETSIFSHTKETWEKNQKDLEQIRLEHEKAQRQDSIRAQKLNSKDASR